MVLSLKAAAMIKFAVFMILLIVLFQESEAGISCSDVTKDLTPCVSYLVNGSSGKPPSDCCDGVKALSAAAKSSADKKAACECIKSAAANVNYNAKLAQNLPTDCGVSLPFPVSAGIDCSKIN